MKLAAALLLIVSALPLWAGKKQPIGVGLTKLPPQTAQIDDLKVPKPKQACPNWVWASAFQLMLEQQQVTDFNQEYWVLKSAAGELCIETPIDFDQLKQWVDGDYLLSDGNHVHLEGVITPGAPQDISHFVQQLKDGRTALVLWKGRPYLLQAIEYDEYIYPNGQRMFEARKLTLLDPLAKAPVIFEKTKDDIADIGGMFEITVGPVDHFR